MILNNQQINYSWSQLATKVGVDNTNSIEDVNEVLGISISYGIESDFQSVGKKIFIRQCSGFSWNNLLDLPKNSLDWIQTDEALPKTSIVAGLKLTF